MVTTGTMTLSGPNNEIAPALWSVEKELLALSDLRSFRLCSRLTSALFAGRLSVQKPRSESPRELADFEGRAGAQRIIMNLVHLAARDNCILQWRPQKTGLGHYKGAWRPHPLSSDPEGRSRAREREEEEEHTWTSRRAVTTAARPKAKLVRQTGLQLKAPETILRAG